MRSGHADERTERRRGAHLYGLKAEIDRGAHPAPQGLYDPRPAFRRQRGRDRPHRPTRRLDRLCGGEGARRSRGRGDCDQRDQAAANRARRTGLAHAEPMGGGPDAAGRRHIRRASAPSPPRAGRV